MKFCPLKWKKCYSALLLIFLVYALQVYHYCDFTIDDAYITARYARNAALGYGLVYNVGQRVMGYTSLLPVLLEALAYRFGADGVGLAKAIGVVSGLAVIGATIRLGSVVFGEGPRNPGILAAGFLAAYPYLPMSAVMGLETNLFAFLILFSVLVFADGMDSSGWSPSRHMALACLLFLATLCRPEGMGFAAILLVTQAALRYLRRRSGRDHVASGVFGTFRVWTWSLTYVVLLLLVVTWLWWYYGSPVPNTFVAKTAAGFSLAKYVNGAGYISTWFNSASLVLTVPLVLWPFIAGSSSKRSVLLGGMCGFFGGYVVYVGGDWMPGYRFLLPILPLYLLLTSDGLLALWRVLSGQLGHISVLARNILAAIVMVALFGTGYRDYFRELDDYVSERAVGYTEAHFYIGQWLQQNASPGDSVALMDIGIIGLLSELQVVDFVGLVDVDVARLVHNGSGSSASDAAVAEAVAQSVLARQPDFIVLAHSEPAPDPFVGWRHDLAVYSSPEFQTQYRRLFTRRHQSDYYLSLYERIPSSLLE